MPSELEQAKADRWFGLIPIGLGLVMVVMAASLGAVGWYQHGKSQAMLSWPSAEGSISSCEYGTYRDEGDSYDSHNRVTTATYVVNGTPYEYSWTERVSAEEAQKGDLPYAIGQKVEIFYDPAAPGRSSRTRDRGTNDFIMFIIAGVCLVIGSPFFFFGFRSLARARRRLADLRGWD